MHPGHQFPDAKRFGDVVIRPQGQTADLVVLAATRSEHEDVAVREGADPSAHLQAVEFGQPQIQHHNIGGKATGLVHGLGTGVRLAGIEAGPDEVGGHHLSQGLFIIDDQHPPRGRGGGRCAVSHRPQYRSGQGGIPPSLSTRRGNLHQIFKHHPSTAVTTVPHPGPAASPPLVGSAGATRDFTACTAYPGRVEGHRPRLWGGVPVVTQPTEFTPFSPCYKAASRVFEFQSVRHPC